MKEKFLHFIKTPKYIYAIYILVSIVSAISKYSRGQGGYNNYLIFKNVFVNTIHQRNIYAPYPEIHHDVNHYGIIFSALIAPFTLFPDWLGLILWNVANVSLLIYAIKNLPFSEQNKSFFAWLCLQELITALVSFQFNVALTGLLLLSFSYIYQRKEAQSAFAIVLGIFVKLYGVVGLSSFFFIKNKRKFILSFVVCVLLLLVIPMTYSSFQFGLQSYVDWYEELVFKNNKNQSLTSWQDISVMGMFRRIIGDASISNLYFLAVGLPLFGLPYLRINQYKNLSFQLLILASTLIFTVIFSSGSESPTYIIAVAGVMIWFIVQEEKTPLVIGLMLFVMVLTCFSPSDLFPKYIRENVIYRYSLKSLPCTLVWLRIIYELMTKNFEKVSIAK